MNVLIAVSYDSSITVSAEHAAALLALIPHIRVVTSSGYGASHLYKIEELPPKVEFIDSGLLAPLSAKEEELRKQFEAKNLEWATAYNDNTKHKQRITDLERELAALRNEA